MSLLSKLLPWIHGYKVRVKIWYSAFSHKFFQPYFYYLSWANNRHTRNIWGFHGGDYEENRLLGYKNPRSTSQETHYISATEHSQSMLCKIWGFMAVTMKNVVFWHVSTCGSCRNLRFGGKYLLHLQGENNKWTINTLATGSDCSTLWRISHCGMELNLWPTVSRPVSLGVGPPFGAHDQILNVLHVGWPLWRENGSVFCSAHHSLVRVAKDP
jgi:hypothetical protein